MLIAHLLVKRSDKAQGRMRMRIIHAVDAVKRKK